MPETIIPFKAEDEKRDAIAFSLVIPVYNEEESLEHLFGEILQVMTSLQSPYEIIFVNDHSCDRSSQILKEFKKNFPEVARVVHLPKRSGQTKGLRKGLDVARGEIVITLDADLQNDPSDIPKFLQKIKEDYSCICGWRKERQDTLLKAGLSKLANFLQRGITGLKIHDVSCTLRAYKKECVKVIPLNWEGQHRFIPLSLSLQGHKIGEVITHHRKRKFGTSKYGHRRIFRVIKDFFKILKAKGKI